MIYIGLTGDNGVGKDTVATMIKEYLEDNDTIHAIEITGFAVSMKKMLGLAGYDMLNVKREEKETKILFTNWCVYERFSNELVDTFESKEEAEAMYEHEAGFNVVLTEWTPRLLMERFTKAVKKNVSKSFFRDALELSKRTSLAILTDVRYEDEAKLLENQILIHVEDERGTPPPFLPIECNRYIIKNTGTFEELRASVGELIESIKEPYLLSKVSEDPLSWSPIHWLQVDNEAMSESEILVRDNKALKKELEHLKEATSNFKEAFDKERLNGNFDGLAKVCIDFKNSL